MLTSTADIYEVIYYDNTVFRSVQSIFIAFILRNISVLFYGRSKTAFHKASITLVPVFIRCFYGIQDFIQASERCWISVFFRRFNFGVAVYSEASHLMICCVCVGYQTFQKKIKKWKISVFCIAPLLLFFLTTSNISLGISGWIPQLVYFVICVHWLPQSHPWCNTYQHLSGQYGSSFPQNCKKYDFPQL